MLAHGMIRKLCHIHEDEFRNVISGSLIPDMLVPSALDSTVGGWHIRIRGDLLTNHGDKITLYSFK